MSTFKSSILTALLPKLLRNALQLFILFLIIKNYPELIPIGFVEIMFVYLLLTPIQLYFTNNDLTINEDEINVCSSLFSRTRKRSFKKSEISTIIFKDDWTDSFMSNIFRFWVFHLVVMWFIPWEYKWIQIKTKDNRKFNYYFFGLEYDYYDNAGEALFDDMFVELEKNNLDVKWKISS